MLLAHFGDEFLDDHEEVGFIIGEEEPRTLAEIAEAEAEFFEKVAYVRFVVRAEKTARGISGGYSGAEILGDSGISRRHRIEVWPR
jgi:hypothetical protein